MATKSENVSLPWVVVGGGMVGGAMALAIAESGRRVVVLEPYPETEFAINSAYDLRISAITADNIALLESLGVWPQVQALRAQPFMQLAVREQGSEWLSFASETSQPLGYMVENKALQSVLTERLRTHALVDYRTEGFTSIVAAKPQVQIKNGVGESEQPEKSAGYVVTSSGAEIAYQYLIGADGVNSNVRSAAGIGTAGSSYQERCLLATVKLAEEIPPETWQIFAGNEVHALLPLANQQACLILYADTAVIKGWPKDAIEAELSERFSKEIGDFQLQNAASFPLKHQHALAYFNSALRTLIIGDAAHGVHPLAGQGVNLGLRDVAAVRDLLTQLADENINFRVKLERALKHRQFENLAMGQGLDTIARVFRAQHPVLKFARRSLFSVMAQSKPLRKFVGRFAGAAFAK
ncbi:FAD-dependent monooxygenase [Aliidiomarina iranensis]|nr:FAD-dependent monooxygenase [Aliidiomarina iranensis]